MLTRKHFQLIANVVKAIDDPTTRAQVAVNFCHEFKRANPRFQPHKFLCACDAVMDG